MKRFETVFVDDTVRLTDEVNRRVAATFPGSWLLNPLAVNGRVWGSLSLLRLSERSHWTRDNIEIAGLIADHVAIAIQQAELLQQVQRELAERTQAEEALRRNQFQLRMFESAIEHANDVIVITEAEPFDVPGPRIVYVNRAFERITGYSRAEAIGNTPPDVAGAGDIACDT